MLDRDKESKYLSKRKFQQRKLMMILYGGVKKASSSTTALMSDKQSTKGINCLQFSQVTEIDMKDF